MALVLIIDNYYFDPKKNHVLFISNPLTMSIIVSETACSHEN